MIQETEIIKDTTHLGDEGELVVNMGPQHPATHGVLHLVVTLNGETIKKLNHILDIFTDLSKKCARV